MADVVGKKSNWDKSFVLETLLFDFDVNAAKWFIEPVVGDNVDSFNLADMNAFEESELLSSYESLKNPLLLLCACNVINFC